MPKITLGALQYAIMKVLWECGEASSSAVHAALVKERGLAPTTIATMLRKMEEKGVVGHRAEGRQFLYAPKVIENEVRQSMVDELVERLFGGDPTALVSHLIEDDRIDAEEIEELRERLAAARAKDEP